MKEIIKKIKHLCDWDYIQSEIKYCKEAVAKFPNLLDKAKEVLSNKINMNKRETSTDRRQMSLEWDEIEQFVDYVFEGGEIK
jgi:hypothetical protein